MITESEKVIDEICLKLNIRNKSVFAKIFSLFIITLDNSTLKYEEGNKYQVIFFKLILSSISKNEFTSVIISKCNKFLNGRGIYLNKLGITSPGLIIDRVFNLIINGTTSFNDIILSNIPISIDQDNLYVIYGFKSTSILECLWMLVASEVMTFIRDDNDIYNDYYSYAYEY